MRSDAYENPISTLSNEVREAYDIGVHRFLGAEPGVETAFQTAIDADESFFSTSVLHVKCNYVVNRICKKKP